MWRTLEPIHGMVYFAPEAAEAYAAAGLPAGRAGYFASRSAAMGEVGAEVVIATFFNFNPELVRSCVPSCWDHVTPEAILKGRLDAVDRSLRRVLGDDVAGPELAEAAELAQIAATAPRMSPAGRPLYAAHAALPWPSEPHLALWHAISVLREYRGDGHIAALVLDGLSGIDALVMHAATGDIPRAALQTTRAWDDAQWDEAAAGLRARGWIDGDGMLTAEGRARRDAQEIHTDELALAPWEHLGAERCARLREIGRPFSKAIVASGALNRPPA
jgi:hypothetical protein